MAKTLKNTKLGITRNAVSGVQKCSEIHLQIKLCPGPGWESLLRSPDSLAGLKRPTSKERREKRRESVPQTKIYHYTTH